MKTDPRCSARSLALLLISLAVLAAAGWAAKHFQMPRPADARSYPAHDDHPAENFTIGVDPYDQPQKADIFAVRYLENNLLPVFFVASNHGAQSIVLTEMRVQMVLRDRSKVWPASDEDVYRRLTRTPYDSSGSRRIPLPVPRAPKAATPRELRDELDMARFHARAVEPGANQAGFFFFDVSGTTKPLEGAHLYVTGVRDGNDQQLMFFDISLDKYVAAQPKQ